MWSDTTTKDTVFEINGKPKEMIQLTCFSKLVPREIKKKTSFSTSSYSGKMHWGRG